MASIAPISTSRMSRLLPDRLLGILALAMLAVTIAALLRGHAHWGQVPVMVWLHLLTIMGALALTGRMMIAPKGDRPHRTLGYVWVTLMVATALLTFGIRQTNHGGFSVIHILSAWVLIQVPIIIRAARRHNVVRHRGAVRGMTIGALLIAGVFTLPFGRMLGSWLFA